MQDDELHKLLPPLLHHQLAMDLNQIHNLNDDDTGPSERDNLLGGIHDELEDMLAGIREEEGMLKVVGSVQQEEDILLAGSHQEDILMADTVVDNHRVEGSVRQHIRQDEKKAPFHYHDNRPFPFLLTKLMRLLTINLQKV